MASKKNAEAKTPASKFRDELTKIMPGFDWTVHKASEPESYLKATGVQTSGFNRLATLQVERRVRNDRVEYEVKSSGYGAKTPWLATCTDGTLARALRGLQEHYQHTASTYGIQATTLQQARLSKNHNRGSAITDLLEERNRQDMKWGGPGHDDAHATTHFLNFIQARAKKAHGQGTTPEARKNLIEIAALAVAAVESMDRKEATDGR